jgi:glutathione S-transferase
LITLFGTLESGNVHKVQLILQYIQKSYLRVDVNQARGETALPEFLDINPIGKIPAVLLEDGDTLSESNAILYYFAQDIELCPENTRDQTEVLRWLFFEQYSHEPTLSVIRYLKKYTVDPKQHLEQVVLLEPKARRALDTLETRLVNRQWIATEVCTIADYSLYLYTKFSPEADFDLSEYPGVQSWLTSVEAQPKFLPMNVDGAEKVLRYEDYFV